MAGRIKVCLILEGSYPFITGGVSAWVHDLITNLPDFDFSLFTISPAKDQKILYKLPVNIVEHADMVLNEKSLSTGKPPSLKGLVGEILDFHQQLKIDSSPDLERLFSLFPEGYSIHKTALERDEAWNLITRTNQEKNPLYPFTDYFWAWKSAHDMIFNILAWEAPKADLYNAISTGFAGLAALAVKFRKKKPLLLTEHGLYHKEREIEIRKSYLIRGYQRDMWINLYNAVSRLCYTQADMVTALFEENRQKQIALGAPPDKAFVIPNGIDIERFTVERKKRPGYHIGLVGRVVPIKDIRTFIVTAKLVVEQIPEAVFYCIGPTEEDPQYYDTCQLLVKDLRLEDKFIFTGRAPVLEYYGFLDLVMLTSIREAQPLVILEAYAAGIPVVSTRVGNVSELLDYDDRFTAAPKDSRKLAEAVEFVYRNPDIIQNLVERNRERVKLLYDKRDLHNRYREIYSSLAGQGL